MLALSAEHLDPHLVARDLLAALTHLGLARLAVGERLLVALEFLEGLGHLLVGALDFLVDIGARAIETLAPLARDPGIGGEGGLQLGRSARGPALAFQFAVDARQVGAQPLRQLLEIGGLAPPLVEGPAVQADQLIQRAHVPAFAPAADVAARISASRP